MIKLLKVFPWLLKNMVEYWKVVLVFAFISYFISINLKLRNLRSENGELSEKVIKQDSVIVSVRSKFLTDSTDMVNQVLSMQQVVNEVNLKNKQLAKDNIYLNQLSKDLADGIKCKNIFGKIVNCK